MNKLNIYSSTYCEIEKQLGILTNEGLNDLLKRLNYIVSDRLNAGLVEHEGLQNIIKLFDVLTIERDSSFGNALVVNNLQLINKVVFDNKSNQSAIEHWLYRGMLKDLAEMIDEGFRYGLDSSDETKLLKDFLFYLTTVYIRIEKG